MNRVLPTLAATACLVLLASPAQALHCNGEIITIGSGNTALYLEDRSDALGEINLWMHLESNGVEGLQSGGQIIIDENCDFTCIFDPCQHRNPDTLIF